MTKAIFPIRIVALVLIFLSVSIYAPKAQALDPKTKTVLTMAGYGTVGGALLGTASLAFGADGRAVSVGASLGLYAGLIFGTYVVVSHRMKSYNEPDVPRQRNYYPGADEASPYGDRPESSYDWGDYFGGGGEEQGPPPNQYWQQIRLEQQRHTQERTQRKMNHWGGRSPQDRTLFYMDFVRYSF